MPEILGTKGPVVRASLADLVYERLLDAILSGRLISGAPLNPADLSKELDVSASPVREALLKLASDGLVDNATNRRATVVALSRSQVAEIFKVREILEAGAAKLAAQRRSDGSLSPLWDVVDPCVPLSGDGPDRKRTMMERDHRFHLLIAQLAGNKMLEDEITRYTRMSRVVQWVRMDEKYFPRATPDHLAVLHAIEDRNADAAQQNMSKHLLADLELVLQNFNNNY